MKKILNNINNEFNNIIKYFKDFLLNIHYGKANISIFKNINIKIDNKIYNIFNLSNISLIDNFTFKIIPYDKKNINKIKNEILINKISNLIFVKKNVIIIKLSLLTEEKRIELINKLKKELEKNINSFRLIRNKYKNIIKNNNKFSKDENENIINDLQKLYNNYLLEIKNIFEKKKKEILNIN
ncbi:MAG: ribosome-recycling factor [Candidatus Shikimatogenerans sp. JK-2022]|nr:ribosome-recycling factor [Candidatus Shikimatogenerans bostrichidophilus]